jgi:phosphoribosylaminoimidazolecarboxamide formyltransferase/IMP cyclohydrolase
MPSILKDAGDTTIKHLSPKPLCTMFTAVPQGRCALLSVSDKTGIVPLAQALIAHGYTILSTGGTARALREAGLMVTEVARVTGSPEILDGRVKTLHPRIHGGLLARRDVPSHLDAMRDHFIADIRVLVVNLYPFAQTVAAGADEHEVIEQIDIGGPAMLRAASKNYHHVSALCDPADYGAFITSLTQGGPDLMQRRSLAARAFAHIAAYDAAIASYLTSIQQEYFPPVITTTIIKQQTLRYGENPHQQAALYKGYGEPDLGGMTQIQGKELSYNNIIDLDAAVQLVHEVSKPGLAACAIIKHTNPAGCARQADALAAYEAALACDPTSAYGGIVAFDRAVDEALAKRISEHFYEIIAAPSFSEAALAVLTAKKSLRLITLPAQLALPPRTSRQTVCGELVQTPDPVIADEQGWRVVTKAQPTAAQREALGFLWRVCKHVKSNAIVIGDTGRTLGVGAGQMSRVDAVRLAVEEARANGLAPGACLASDAFFPFVDGPKLAMEAGVGAIIQPGGSVRDQEIIDACDTAGVAMIFTDTRHFRHG